MNAGKKQLANSLATASAISWACADTAAGLDSQDFEAVYVEGFVHSSPAILLGSLKRVLSENCMTDAGDILQTAFEEVNPGPGNDYMYHPTIKNFLKKPLWISSLQTNKFGYISASQAQSSCKLSKQLHGLGPER